jgi:uncharacterized coiled-coil DUF342 family protein
MSRATDQLLAELRDFRAEARADLRSLTERLDGVNTRLDTVIDSVAQLRTDLAGHNHD